MGKVRKIETESIDDDRNYTQKSNFTATFVGLIFIGILCGMFGTVYLIDGILPSALKITDEPDNPDSFIAERAQNHLKLLTDMGPRVTGSYENEVLAVEMLKKEIDIIKQQAHNNQEIELDIQIVSGSFDAGKTSTIYAYNNVQNVVAKLHSDNSKYSLLVNAHFDTVPTSPGGTDDGINCAIMLEVLRKLSQSSVRPKHNIIFLFNGAEEIPVQAAHGFITQHKWAKGVQVLVNLEAAGAGGKQTLFQAGPKQPWMVRYYSKVPHPNAQAAAEEMFQTGLIPSGTDFIIFQRFGNLTGLDFAFIRNGYRYHTKYDNFSNIPSGSYQYAGDNALSIIQALANAPELPNGEANSEDTTFYDYLGLFLISYTKTVAIAVNWIVSILSFFIIIKSFFDFRLGCSKQSLKCLFFTMLGILLGWFASAVLVVAVGEIIDALNFTLSWYGNPWIIFGIYVLPTIITSCGLIAISNAIIGKKDITISAHIQIQAHLVRLLWTIILLVGTIIELRSIYIVLMPVLFQTLAFIIIHILGWQHSKIKWLITYLISTIIPNMFIMQQTISIFTFIIPICGRIGPATNPETLISLLTLLFTLLVVSCYTPLIMLIRKPAIILTILSGLFIISLIIVFTPLGFPYTGNSESPTPQRFWIYHSCRTLRDERNVVYKQDAGFFIYNEDRNSPHSVKEYVKDLSNTTSIADDCYNSLFCGLPLGRYGSADATKSTWIPAEQPTFHEPMKLQLTSQSTEDDIRTFNFTASGPDRLEIYVSPKFDVKLTAVSLVPHLPSKIALWNERPVYIIVYAWGKRNTALSFSLEFETPQHWNRSTFDIALVARYLHNKMNVHTPHYEQFLSEFPDWADVSAWLSAYESWVY